MLYCFVLLSLRRLVTVCFCAPYKSAFTLHYITYIPLSAIFVAGFFSVETRTIDRMRRTVSIRGHFFRKFDLQSKNTAIRNFSPNPGLWEASSHLAANMAADPYMYLSDKMTLTQCRVPRPGLAAVNTVYNARQASSRKKLYNLATVRYCHVMSGGNGSINSPNKVVPNKTMLFMGD